MGYITQRLYQFRGINRSARQNTLDLSSAYDAVNVDVIGGKLTNRHIGSSRLISKTDVSAARPILFFRNTGNYLILRDKFIDMGGGIRDLGEDYMQGDVNLDGKVSSPDAALASRHVDGLITLTGQAFINADVDLDGDVTKDDAETIMKYTVGLIDRFPISPYVGGHINIGPYEADIYTIRPAQDVVNDTELNIRGVGRNYVRANIDNMECVIASGMLGVNTGYYEERGFFTDGAFKTAVYYLGNEQTPKIHVRQFGSGLYLRRNSLITGTTANGDGTLATVTTGTDFSSMTDEQKSRALLDGVYVFANQIEDPMDEDDVNDAYMWLKVTNIAANGNGKTVYTVSTTRKPADISNNSYIYIRGGCSDMPVGSMQMYYGRLFAAGHKNGDHPRRLYWSCLPGDGRTIEDWTLSDASVDTSGGHVDVGDPSDGYITNIIVSGSQLLIFTKNRLWRLYGTAPSNYRLELIGDLEGSCISNPVEINGTVYWLSLAGIAYYNGSYIAHVDDDYSTRYLLDSLPDLMKNSLMYSTVHAVLFDNSIMFSFDGNGGLGDKCLILRYELETGNVFKYEVPCANFKQQFTDSVKDDFSAIGGTEIKYETRYFQAIVHTDGTMTLTQWADWGRQSHGWYDGQKVESRWEIDWTDALSPESVKKANDVCVRGNGRFDFTLWSEINSESNSIDLPDDAIAIRDIAPHVAQGRVFRFAFTSDKPFEVEPGFTMKYEVVNVR